MMTYIPLAQIAPYAPGAAGAGSNLAAIGLYGVMSYNVAQRTNEMGVLLALGAQKQNVLWIILREALLLLSAGVAVGLPLSLVAARFVRDQLLV